MIDEVFCFLERPESNFLQSLHCFQEIILSILISYRSGFTVHLTIFAAISRNDSGD
jgi:hypothetical protein